MASLRGPVTPSPAEREIVRLDYRDARRTLRDARHCFEQAAHYRAAGQRDVAADWMGLAVSALTWADYLRANARRRLRMFSGLAAW